MEDKKGKETIEEGEILSMNMVGWGGAGQGGIGRRSKLGRVQDYWRFLNFLNPTPVLLDKKNY